MSNCIFCQIINKEIPAEFIHEDEHCIVIQDIAPKADTHLLLIPKEHVVNLDDMDSSHASLISHMMLLLPQLAKKQGLDTGFCTIINTGKGGGQEVFHLHIHLLGGKNLPGFV